jgi:EXS family
MCPNYKYRRRVNLFSTNLRIVFAQIWWDLFMDWGLFVRDPLTGGWNLRSQRLYPSQSIYWALAVVNTLLRFCWTLSFVPLRYLSTAGVLTNNFSSDTWASILAPTIASAEVVRRTLWGLLRVEWEAIKVRGEEIGKNHDENDDGGLEMMPMKMQGGGVGVGATPLERLGLPPCTSDMSSMNNMQVLGELCLYSTVFAILGLIIAAHRETL